MKVKRTNSLIYIIVYIRLQVWQLLLAGLILLAPVTWLLHRRGNLSAEYQHFFATIVAQCECKRSFDYELLKPYTCLVCVAGQRVYLNGVRVRLLWALWYLMSAVFVSAYVGTLVSFLSVPKLDPIISKFEELPKSGLKWLVQNGLESYSTFLVIFSSPVTFLLVVVCYIFLFAVLI